MADRKVDLNFDRCGRRGAANPGAGELYRPDGDFLGGIDGEQPAPPKQNPASALDFDAFKRVQGPGRAGSWRDGPGRK